MTHPRMPRQLPGLQQPRSGREHPYPCHTPARAASARARAALGFWLPALLALAALLATAWGWGQLSNISEARLRHEYCEGVRSGLWPDYRNTFKAWCAAPAVRAEQVRAPLRQQESQARASGL